MDGTQEIELSDNLIVEKNYNKSRLQRMYLKNSQRIKVIRLSVILLSE